MGARYSILSPNLGGLCLSLGGFAGRGFIQVGAFAGCQPWAGPFWLTVAAVPSAGASKGEFSVLAASTDPEVFFCK